MGTDYSDDRKRSAEESNKGAGKKRRREFEKKYADVINAIREMPAGTKEARRKRWEWFCGLDVKDDFTLELMQAMRPRKFERMKRALFTMPDDPGGERYLAEQDRNMAGLEMRALDTVAFQEALKRVIESLCDSDDEKKSSLIACMETEYKQTVSLEYGENAMNAKSGLVFEIQGKRKCALIKLVREVMELTNMMRLEKKPVTREKIEELVCSRGKNLSREEIRTAVQLVEGMKSISLDQEETRETLESEGHESLQAGDGTDPDKGISSDGSTDFLEALTESVESSWQEIRSASGKRDQELLKAFITKEILIALKLDYVNENYRRKWKEELEPKCGQWCQKRERCKLERKDGCYVRYGRVLPVKEAGDRDIYEALKVKAGLIYRNILKNDYTDYAFEEPVNSLYDIYANSLRDFKGKGETFQFTDAVMGQALGLKPYVISRSRKQYETKVKQELYKVFRRIREE